jgi:hypothetical protein
MSSLVFDHHKIDRRQQKTSSEIGSLQKNQSRGEEVPISVVGLVVRLKSSAKITIPQTPLEQGEESYLAIPSPFRRVC